MKRVMLFFIPALLFFFCNSCDNKRCCITDECYGYQFKLPMNIHPLKDTFNIGDTITVTSIFSDEVEDLRDGRKYELIDFDFYPITTIAKIDQDPRGSAFNSDSFEYWVEADTFITIRENTFEAGIAYIYKYANNQYLFALKFIINEAGIYGLLNGTAIPSAYSHQSPDFPGKCGRRPLDAHFYMNDRTDNNYELLNLSPDSDIRNESIEDLDGGGAYFFVVVP